MLFVCVVGYAEGQEEGEGVEVRESWQYTQEMKAIIGTFSHNFVLSLVRKSPFYMRKTFARSGYLCWSNTFGMFVSKIASLY